VSGFTQELSDAAVGYWRENQLTPAYVQGLPGPAQKPEPAPHPCWVGTSKPKIGGNAD